MRPVLSDAINAYTRALDIEKGNNPANRPTQIGHSKLADAYVGLGDVYASGVDPDFEKARSFYTQAQKIDPDSAQPAVGFGNILLGSGRIREAVDQYKKSLEAALKRIKPVTALTPVWARLTFILASTGWRSTSAIARSVPDRTPPRRCFGWPTQFT